MAHSLGFPVSQRVSSCGWVTLSFPSWLSMMFWENQDVQSLMCTQPGSGVENAINSSQLVGAFFECHSSVLHLLVDGICFVCFKVMFIFN